MSVTGILKDIPANSSLEFHYLVPFSYYEASEDWVKQTAGNWRNSSFQTFVALQPNASYPEVAQQLKELFKKYDPEDYKASKNEIFIQPMSHWHLYTEFKNSNT